MLCLRHGWLVIKRRTPIAVIAYWLIQHGWNYQVTPRRTIVLCTPWHQGQCLWNKWQMVRMLKKRLAADEGNTK